MVSKRYVSYLRVSTPKQGENGLGVEAQREAVRRYLLSHHGEQIAEFVEVESGKRSDRPQLAAAMALAKKRKATLLVAKLDRLSRSVAFIATLMDSKGFDLAIADMPGANRLTLHVLAAAAEHERHMIGEHTPCAGRRQSPWHQARQSRAGQDQSGEGGRAGAGAAPAHRALHQGWPHIEQCHRNRSQRARHRGTEWRPMVSDAGSSRSPSSRPMIDGGLFCRA